jgi:threonyl-tRNA synthetase
VQAIVCPIAERHQEYAQDLDLQFKKRGLRSLVDGSREKIGHKIRDAELKKIPLILVIGDKEVSQGTASLRIHGKGDRGAIKIPEFLEKVMELNDNKSLELNFKGGGRSS